MLRVWASTFGQAVLSARGFKRVGKALRILDVLL
jgi:hypothetical protein